LEDRFYIPWNALGLIGLGMTAFADAGTMWPGEVPFGRTSPWMASVGAGLRLGIPRGTRHVIRVDVALPVNGASAWRSPVVRVSFGEYLGFAAGFDDPEVSRSRRQAVGADVLSTERR
jgi:hypothetical protein